MKLVGRIICTVLLAITMIFSTVFAFVEFRSLIAGDYSLMNSAALGLVTYLLRAIFFVILLSFSLFLMMTYLKNNEMNFNYYFVGVLLLIGSLFSIHFYSTYVYFAVIFIAILPCLTFVIRKFTLKCNLKN